MEQICNYKYVNFCSLHVHKNFVGEVTGTQDHAMPGLWPLVDRSFRRREIILAL